MLHNFYLVDFTYTGTVTLRVASLGENPLNTAPVNMTKREGGYSAQIDVPEGVIAVSYRSNDDPRTIDINELVIVAPPETGTDLTPVLDAIAEIPTNPLLAGNYVAPDNDAIADLAQSVAQIPTVSAPAPSAIATAVQEALEPQLDAIAASADKARAADTNKAIANPITGTTTVFADDGTTPLYRIRTSNANGEPSLEDTVLREVVPLT